MLDPTVRGIFIPAIQSSGHKQLDKHVAWWVQNKWKFPPGEPRVYEYPVVFMIQR